jgi:hypothetical protein
MSNNNTATNETDDLFGDADIIHAYSRAQALEDGDLVDVTTSAREAGFRFPVALTRAVWAGCVEWSEADSRRQVPQDESGRLWDVLTMARWAAKMARPGQDRVRFHVLRVPRGGKGMRARKCELVLHIGPGDDAAPVMTIMAPEEL